jgi:hypothetical protein
MDKCRLALKFLSVGADPLRPKLFAGSLKGPVHRYREVQGLDLPLTITRRNRPTGRSGPAARICLPRVFMVRLLSPNRDGGSMIAAALAVRNPAASAAEWLRIGQHHHRSGRKDEAIAAYECGLAAALA